MSASAALAATVAVGPASCQPGVPHYATIQSAVNAVQGLAGSTVYVCPGTYPEQVVIGSPLTLKGVGDDVSNDVVITVPAGGLVPNFVSPAYGPAAAQLLVTNTAGVKVVNLVIDGSGLACPADTGLARTVGLQFLNVGGPSLWNIGGGIQNVVVRNQAVGCAGVGQGIVAENSYLALTTSTVTNVSGDCISQTGGTNAIISNTIHGCAQAGIALYGVTQGAVLTNVVANGSNGILLDATRSVVVMGNVLGPWAGVAIFVKDGSAQNTIMTNRVFSSYIGIELYESGANNVQGNMLTHIEGYGIADGWSAGGNSVTNNTIVDVPFGLWLLNAADDTLTPNTFVGVKVRSYTP